MAESNYRVAIVVAVIGVIGTLGAAFIGNWDKIFAPSPKSSPKIDSAQTTRVEPRPPAEAIPNIGGVWRDSNYPINGTRITQDGNMFHFTRWGVLPNGTTFESSGSGTIAGQRLTSNYNARYKSGATSEGGCSGTVALNGMHMELNCTDSLLGTFPGDASRQE